MRHSVFSVISFVVTPAVLLVLSLSGFSLSAVAQHSSGGGGGAVSSGGSHEGFSGGGGSASHSSGGSSSHGSASAAGAHHSGANPAHGGMRFNTRQPEKRGFFSALRHPFRKAEPKEVVELRRRICPNGRCQVCAPGSTGGRWGCGGTANSACSSRQIWGGGACLLQTNFLDDCLAEQAAQEHQQTRMRDAESARQMACSSGSPADCTASSAAAQSEASLYQSLQIRYRQCRDRSLLGRPFDSNVFFDPRFSFGLMDGMLYVP